MTQLNVFHPLTPIILHYALLNTASFVNIVPHIRELNLKCLCIVHTVNMKGRPRLTQSLRQVLSKQDT